MRDYATKFHLPAQLEAWSDKEAAVISLVIASAWTYLSYYPYLIVENVHHRIDNAHPRQAQEKSSNNRLISAHYNMNESFPRFAAAILAALCMNVPMGPVAVIAWNVYLPARLLHYVFYAVNLPNLRTPAMFMSFHATLRIFLLALGIPY